MRIRARKKIFWPLILLLFLFSVFLGGCVNPATDKDQEKPQVIESHAYLEKDDVIEYLARYQHLPPNYLTKKEAKKLGWKTKSQNLWELKPGAAIGGDVFTNRERKLPAQKYGFYLECDVNYQGGPRGPERLVYTRDGKIIYYTGNHYRSFTQVKGAEDGY